MRFILVVQYGTGKAAMVVHTPIFQEALQEFLDEYKKGIPDTKMYGLPDIKNVELIPLLERGRYESI